MLILLSLLSVRADDYMLGAFATQVEATNYQTSVGNAGNGTYCSAYVVENQQAPSLPWEVWTPEILGTRRWMSPSAFRIDWVSNNRVSIAIGQGRDYCDQQYIYLDSPISIVDLSASGANGLDTGVEASNTWYAVWVVRATDDPLDVIGLLSTSATNPTLPPGYSIKRRVGWIRNDSGSNILPFFMQPYGENRRVEYDVAAATLAVLSGGTATVFTDVNLSSLIPPTADIAILDVETGGQNADVRTNGAVNARGQRTPASDESRIDIMPDSNEIVEYRNGAAGGSTTIRVMGYMEAP